MAQPTLPMYLGSAEGKVSAMSSSVSFIASTTATRISERVRGFLSASVRITGSMKSFHFGTLTDVPFILSGHAHHIANGKRDTLTGGDARRTRESLLVVAAEFFEHSGDVSQRELRRGGLERQSMSVRSAYFIGRHIRVAKRFPPCAHNPPGRTPKLCPGNPRRFGKLRIRQTASF
jgi:hypothetical protein